MLLFDFTLRSILLAELFKTFEWHHCNASKQVNNDQTAPILLTLDDQCSLTLIMHTY